jgi:hypothetical protein
VAALISTAHARFAPVFFFAVRLRRDGRASLSITIPFPLTQRVVMNYYTAKHLLHALQLTVQRHEAVFGALETDVQKRVGRT